MIPPLKIYGPDPAVYFDVVRSRKGIFIFVVLLAAIVASFVRIKLPEKYISEQGMVVGSASGHDFGTFFKDKGVANYVIATQGIPIAPDEMISYLDVDANPGTNFINITVTTDQYADSDSILESYVKIFSRYCLKRLNVEAKPLGEIKTKHYGRKDLPIFIMLAGFLVGLVAAFLREGADHTIRYEEEIAYFLGLKIFGVMPNVLRPDVSASYMNKIVHEEPDSLFAEHLRNIRVSLILEAGVDEELQVLTVTSCKSGDGKTFLASNLAIEMAHSMGDTVLINGDLGNECDCEDTLFSCVGVETNRPGIIELLNGQCSVEDAVSETEIPGVFVIDKGYGKLPTANFEDAIKKVGDHLRFRFKRIIIDAPPMTDLAESPVWTSIADAIIMVVRGGKTALGTAKHAKEALFTGKKVEGIVFNQKK